MIHSLRTLNFRENAICYTGRELSAHWIYTQFNLLGNALIAFQGPADVSLTEMVDVEDVKKKAPIGSPKMLHFLGEFFIDSLDEGILLQHLFVFEVYEQLLIHGSALLTRRGNDLFHEGRKLSVSIATKTPVSVLMHFGINIETHGTPIPTAGLLELGIEPEALAQTVLAKFQEDVEIWSRSRVKVTAR